MLPYNIHNVHGLYAMYGHSFTGSPDLIYAGVTKLASVFLAPDAHGNSKWQELVAVPRAAIELHFLLITPEKAEAFHQLRLLIGIMKPVCNMTGYRDHGRQRIVYCVETGENWFNASAAAKAIGCAATTMSNHLLNRPGYEQVRGRHYKRGAPPALQPQQPPMSTMPVMPAAVIGPTATPIRGPLPPHAWAEPVSYSDPAGITPPGLSRPQQPPMSIIPAWTTPPPSGPLPPGWIYNEFGVPMREDGK